MLRALGPIAPALRIGVSAGVRTHDTLRFIGSAAVSPHSCLPAGSIKCNRPVAPSTTRGNPEFRTTANRPSGRRGGASPRGRLSAAVGCTEPTIPGSSAVTATRSARLSQTWQRDHADWRRRTIARRRETSCVKPFRGKSRLVASEGARAEPAGAPGARPPDPLATPSRRWRAAQTARVEARPAARLAQNGTRRPPQRRRAAERVNANGGGSPACVELLDGGAAAPAKGG